MSKTKVESPDIERNENPKEWPGRFMRLVLWPIADFNWRVKRDSRIRSTRLTPIQHYAVESDGGVQPVKYFPILFRGDGTIRCEFPREGKIEQVEVRQHSQVFSINVPDVAELPSQYRAVYQNLAALKRPIVCSDGIYVRIRDSNAQFFRAFTYQPGVWIEWRVEDSEAKWPGLFLFGGRNYLYLGRHALGSLGSIFVFLAIAVAVLFFTHTFLETWYTK